MRGLKILTRIGIVLLAVGLAFPNASAEDRPDGEPSPLLSGISDDELDAQRGGDAVPVSEATLTATFEQNTITSALTGNNSVGGDAFTGASGFFTVIQNSGNGVIIQDSTIINLSLE
jgi:hypothetical protein